MKSLNRLQDVALRLIASAPEDHTLTTAKTGASIDGFDGINLATAEALKRRGLVTAVFAEGNEPLQYPYLRLTPEGTAYLEGRCQ